MQIFISISISLVVFLGILFTYRRNKRAKIEKAQQHKVTLATLLDLVKESVNVMLQENVMPGITKEEYMATIRLRTKLRNSLINSTHAILEDKIMVKGIIKNIIKNELPDEDKIKEVVDFESKYLQNNIIFECILQHYMKEYKTDAFNQFILQNDLIDISIVKDEEDEDQEIDWVVTEEELIDVWAKLRLKLSYEDKLNIITTLIYQKYKGLGIIDTLNDLDHDGISIGVSGAKMQQVVNQGVLPYNNCVWVLFKGREVHLKFLAFDSRSDIARVIKTRSRFNAPAPLTEKNPHVVTTDPIGNRVSCGMPPFATDWFCFIRKFTLQDNTLEGLITNNNKELASLLKNITLPIKLASWIVKGERNTAITGGQGSGKSTFLLAIIGAIRKGLTIRLVDVTFENRLAETYPDRNTLQVRSTGTVSLRDAQEFLKKTNANVTIVGEAAQAEVTKEIIKTGKVGSDFTMFTHHAKTTKDLMLALRNDLTEAGNFDNLDIAEQDVVEVINMDIHLNKRDGVRYIERITEVVKKDSVMSYPEYDPELSAEENQFELNKAFYIKSGEQRHFDTRELMRFDFDTKTYIPVQWFSEETERQMMNKFTPKERKEFMEFKKEFNDLIEEVAV